MAVLEPDRETGRLMRHPDDGWTLADPCSLSDRSRRALRGLIRAICPRQPCVDEDRLEQAARRTLTYMHPLFSRGMLLAMHLLDLAPLWCFQGFRPLHRLPPDRAQRLLDTLAVNPFSVVRNLLLPWRALLLSLYFDQDEVHRALDYDPVSWMQERIELRRRILRESDDSQVR